MITKPRKRRYSAGAAKSIAGCISSSVIWSEPFFVKSALLKAKYIVRDAFITTKPISAKTNPIRRRVLADPLVKPKRICVELPQIIPPPNTKIEAIQWRMRKSYMFAKAKMKSDTPVILPEKYERRTRVECSVLTNIFWNRSDRIHRTTPHIANPVVKIHRSIPG